MPVNVFVLEGRQRIWKLAEGCLNTHAQYGQVAGGR
jgi:hypothetical protein